MKILGAVLEEPGRPRAYAHSKPMSLLEPELDGIRHRPMPMLLGHEAAGRVVGVGDGVDDLTAGQRVVMSFLPRCGECPNCDTNGRLPCDLGSAANNSGELLTCGRRLHPDGQPVHHHLGVSSFADHAVIDPRSLMPVDDDVPPHTAAVLGCAVLTGVAPSSTLANRTTATWFSSWDSVESAWPR